MIFFRLFLFHLTITMSRTVRIKANIGPRELAINNAVIINISDVTAEIFIHFFLILGNAESNKMFIDAIHVENRITLTSKNEAL